jgi:hypothetical protein
MPPKFDPKYNGRYSTPRRSSERKATKESTDLHEKVKGMVSKLVSSSTPPEFQTAPQQQDQQKKWTYVMQKSGNALNMISASGGTLVSTLGFTIFCDGKAYVYAGPLTVKLTFVSTAGGMRTRINGLPVEEWARTSGCKEYTLEKFCEKYPEFSLA